MVVAQCLQTERCSDISSSLCFSCAMMGLQATSGKRKLEGGVGCMDFDMELGESPSKLGRVEGSWWAMDDSYSSSPPALSQTTSTAYYDMEIVASSCLQSATPNNPCQLSPVHNPTTTTTTTGSSTTNSLTNSTQQSTANSQSQQSSQLSNHHQQQQQQHHHQQQQQQQQQQHYYQRPNGSSQSYQQQQQQQQLSRPQPSNNWGHHTNAPHHYEPPTIRREENGKSYLELGSSYRANERCCEGSRSSWCRRGRACYRQRRLAVLNISMCKLARYRQFPDPSLHRSVLICNTLRYLEREMERDRSPPPMEPVMPAPMAQLQQPEQGRLTPFPMPATSSAETDVDSGIGDSDDSRSINWGSVLSLSSQSPLDPLNNNELLDVDIGPDLDLDFMPGGWKLTPLTSSSSASSTTAEDLLRGITSSSSNEPVMAQQQQQQQQQQHHHSHQQHLQNGLQHLHHHQGNPSGSCNNASGASSGSSTHESLMCVGS